jgi:hypothetical protein
MSKSTNNSAALKGTWGNWVTDRILRGLIGATLVLPYVMWNAPTEVVHQLGYDYPVLGGLNDGWKTRETRRYCAKASAS